MRLNRFAREATHEPDADPTRTPPAAAPGASQVPQPKSGRTFPADEVVWGIVIRSGFDEIDDPWYHRGTTQHAYLEGNDAVALCGFRPPQSGSRTRRRARLGLPTTGQHPMCGMCARMVVAPRPKVPVPVRPALPVTVPVARGTVPGLPVGAVAPVPQAGVPAQMPVSPWVSRAAGEPQPQSAPGIRPDSHDSGLMDRGVHADIEP